MNEEQAPSMRQQIDDKIIDARNEIIMQATNAFLLGRQVMLTGVGMTCLGLEQVQALFQQAVTRGEVVESDTQQSIKDLQHRVSERTTAQISSGLAGLLNKVPGVQVAYKTPAAPAQSEGGAPPAP